jgi:SpoVK/Ycf46/Vps4 family AAA+-type ATPase
LLDIWPSASTVRCHAHQQRWERTQVNELLKRLELYSGWFCAATNWPDGFDPAVLRRFDFKFSFQWLECHQRASLFERFCADHAVISTLTRDALESAMENLRLLLPGDLAALRRRIKMSGQVTDQELLQWVHAEIALKPEAKIRALGFTRAA